MVMMAKTESEALNTLIWARVDRLRWSQIRHRDRTASFSRLVSSQARVLVASTQGAAYLTVSEIARATRPAIGNANRD